MIKLIVILRRVAVGLRKLLSNKGNCYRCDFNGFRVVCSGETDLWVTMFLC